MPSRMVALGLVAMVLLAGCSMLGGGGGGGPAADGPDRHEFVFASDTSGHPFEATVTVTRDGETVVSETVSGDGNGTFANLSVLESPGPYEVTVNTTLPAAGGGNMSERVTVPGGLGNETVLAVNYQGIDVRTLRLPRESVREPLRFKKRFEMPVPATIVVDYRGERVVSTTVEEDGYGPFEVADLRKTGVYRVAVSSHDGGWTNETVLLTHPGQKLLVTLDEDDPILVYEPDQRIPRGK